MESENFNILPDLPANMQSPEIKIIKTNEQVKSEPKKVGEESIFEKYKTFIYGFIIVVLIVVIGVIVYLYVVKKTEPVKKTIKQPKPSKKVPEEELEKGLAEESKEEPVEEPEEEVVKPKIKLSSLNKLLKMKKKTEVVNEGEKQLAEHIRKTKLEEETIKEELQEKLKQEELEQKELQAKIEQEELEQEALEKEKVIKALESRANAMASDDMPMIEEPDESESTIPDDEDKDDAKMILMQQQLSKKSVKMLSKDNFITIENTDNNQNDDSYDESKDLDSLINEL